MPLLEAFQKGLQATVPLIIGSNRDDASVAVAFGIDPAQLVRRMGRARILIQPLYPGVTDAAQLGREVARDVVFTAFARRIAYLHSRKSATWRYYFSHASAVHGAEIPFVLGTARQCQCIGRPVTPVDLAVERRLGDRWTVFAISAKPDGDVLWPPDNRVRGLALEIGEQETPRPAFMSTRLNALITGLNLAGSRSARQQPSGR